MGIARCDLRPKVENLNSASLLLTLRRVSGFLTDANAARKSASVDCEEMNSVDIGIYTSSLSMVPAIMQAPGIEGTDRRLGSAISSSLVIFVISAWAKHVLRYGKDCAFITLRGFVPTFGFETWQCSRTGYFIPARWTMSNSNIDSLKFYRARKPPALAMVRIC